MEQIDLFSTQPVEVIASKMVACNSCDLRDTKDCQNEAALLIRSLICWLIDKEGNRGVVNRFREMTAEEYRRLCEREAEIAYGPPLKRFQKRHQEKRCTQ